LQKGDFLIGAIHKFGVVSDTHLGNKAQQLTHLNEFYKLCKTRKCEFVVHAGDLTDGINFLSDCQKDQFLFSADDTVEYVVDNYPSGIQTYFIAGNHDEKFVKSVGADVCSEISILRKDLHYLGNARASAVLNETNFFLVHGIGSGSVSSRLESAYKAAARSGFNPDMVINGHMHTWGINPYYKGCFLLQAPCFVGQNASMKASGVHPSIGAAIIYIDSDGNRSIECISYGEMKNDY